jgi:hypothetical protein
MTRRLKTERLDSVLHVAVTHLFVFVGGHEAECAGVEGEREDEPFHGHGIAWREYLRCRGVGSTTWLWG